MGTGRSFALALAGVAAYGLAIRPWFMRWGATNSEVERELPGDGLTSNSAWQSTRAVTIHAPVDTVWSLLVQAGRRRDVTPGPAWLMSLVGGRRTKAAAPVAEPQARKVGDSVWLPQPGRCCESTRCVVALLEQNRAMVLVSPAKAERLTTGDPGGEGSRAFVIEPLGERSVRLIVRSRAGENLGVLGWLYAYLITDPGHFLIERRMMLDIKTRAEQSAQPPAADK